MSYEESAFPLVEPVQSGATVHTGMTLRDYMAAKAMQATIKLQHLNDLEHHQKAVASQAYKMADAMLEQREKK